MGLTVARVKHLVKIWFLLALRAAQVQLLTRWGSFLFLLGKVVRFVLFFVFLFMVLSSAQTLAGYRRVEVILFFLVFNLVDITLQFLFRGVYQFRFRIVSGDYDLDLLKPLPSFFLPILGWSDILDFLTLIPLWGYFFWFIFENQLFSSGFHLVGFWALFLSSLVLGFAFHLFICAVGVLTTEIDHLVWVYRDLTNMARFPTDIYQKGVRWILTFVIPVVILISFPTKALLGLLSPRGVGLAFFASGGLLLVSLKFWQFALSRYSSASS
jgi:ABC-2 type transport system permease protein